MRTRRGSLLVMLGLVLTLSGLAGPALAPRTAQATTTGCANFAGGDLFGCQVSGAGTYGWYANNSSTAANATGVYAANSALSGTTFGLRALVNSPSGVAVRGYNSATSGNTAAISGQSQSPTGVGLFGYAPTSGTINDINYGVQGRSDSIAARGVYGYVSSSNLTAITFGVVGISEAGKGFGLWGKANRTTGVNYGVYGESASSSGYGVYGVGGSTSGTNYGVYGTTNSPNGWAGYFDGNVHVTGDLSTGGCCALTIDHPLDPANRTLSLASVASPELTTVYNGNITTDAKGEAVVTLPNYFESLNRDFRYQLTVVGQFAQAIVADEIENNRFTIKTDKPSVKVSWQVTGVRNDPYARQHPIKVEAEKPAAERGKYLYPQEYGQSQAVHVNDER